MFIRKTPERTTAHRRLSLPDGYRVREIGGRLYLFNPRGIPLAGPANAVTIEKHAWRDVWRQLDDDLGEEVAALRAGSRPLYTLRRVRQYLRMVDAVNDQQRAARTRPIRRDAVRWGALAVSAALAAALVIGPMRAGRIPEVPVRLTTPSRHSAPVSAARPEALGPVQRGTGAPGAAPSVSARRAAARPVRPARVAVSPSHPPTRPEYGVVVGVFANAGTAEQVMHLVRSKGYIVNVVRHGMETRVMTPPYRTRTQAERVAHALEDIGLPARLTALWAP